MAEKIRVVIADDHELVRSGFAMILSTEEQIQVVGQAADGEQALALVAEFQPDVVLMDVQMPKLNGIEATRRICQSSDSPSNKTRNRDSQSADLPAIGKTKVLMLTTFDREDYLFQALEAGASGFLLKTCGADELVKAIQKIAAGQGLLAPEMTLPLIQRLVAEKIPAQQPTDEHPGVTALEIRAFESLTPREREVLKLLGQGKTNAEMAEELYLGLATVKTHVANVLAKTYSRDRVGAAIFALKTAGLNPTAQEN